MTSEKETKNIKKKLTIRQHFPSESTEYNRHIGQLQRETTSIDENLESVFRTMWKTNLLIKNMMDSIAVSEAKHDYKKSGHMDSTLKDLYKTIWKINFLIKNMMNSITVSEAKNDSKKSGHMDSTLKDLYKIIWKLNCLLNDQFRLQA
ncbi:uncharacterized protein LOC107885118 [Acyrthosiphon pisum]|uniref:Uncharacterized protein n=1 Tax=Acyrthosiphon pisum TaxID=7029 RepID=A0A8R2D6K7_ACYPI|nr:uncharacterized protein LOC107885118 [Acyrthosiphon pisum]|eukprot:XP_016664079.1 PREDICTED: uncharacterized protein LOC107885118 [Acyrthosiphon pisum]